MPPQANPGRSRYQPGSPTAVAGTSVKVTVLVVTSRRPRGAHAPGSTSTPPLRRSTANSPGGRPSTAAVTRACETRSASEHQGLTPDSRQVPSARGVAARRGAGWCGRPHAPGRARRGGSAGLVEDGDGIPVRFDRAGRGEVDAAERGQGGERAPGAAPDRPRRSLEPARQLERGVDVAGDVARGTGDGGVAPVGERPGPAGGVHPVCPTPSPPRPNRVPRRARCAVSQTPDPCTAARRSSAFSYTQVNRGRCVEVIDTDHEVARRRPLAELVLVRHGESVGNLAAAAAGEQGPGPARPRVPRPRHPVVRQRDRAGERRSDATSAGLPETARPQVVLGSPYVRAASTMEHVLEGWADGPAPVLDERLRERDLGLFDGMTGQGIRDTYPEEAARREAMGKFYYRPPGGESWTDVVLRVRSVLGDVRQTYAGRRVWIFSHQAVIMAFRYLLESLSEQELLRTTAAPRWATARSPSTGRAGGPAGSRDLRLGRAPRAVRGRADARGAARGPVTHGGRGPVVTRRARRRRRSSPRRCCAGGRCRHRVGARTTRVGSSSSEEASRPPARCSSRPRRPCAWAPARCRWPRRPPPRPAGGRAARVPVVGLARGDGEVAPASAERLLELAEQADAVLAGPGIGDPDAARALMRPSSRGSTSPWWSTPWARPTSRRTRRGRHLSGRALLTPNAGELAQVLDEDPDVRRGRPARRRPARRLPHRGHGAVRRSRAPSSCEPSGEAWRLDVGAPGAAVAGSGDVKAGAVAGLLARGTHAGSGGGLGRVHPRPRGRAAHGRGGTHRLPRAGRWCAGSPPPSRRSSWASPTVRPRW